MKKTPDVKLPEEYLRLEEEQKEAELLADAMRKAEAAEIMPLVERLGRMADPRVAGRSDHLLVDIMVIALCAIICGAEHWTEIEAFGRSKEKWFRSFLRLPNGIPSHDTIGRVFAILDPKQLRQ